MLLPAISLPARYAVMDMNISRFSMADVIIYMIFQDRNSMLTWIMNLQLVRKDLKISLPFLSVLGQVLLIL